MCVEMSPIGYELSKDRLRRIAHNVEMARPYRGEARVKERVEGSRDLVKGILGHPWVRWIHPQPAGHARG